MANYEMANLYSLIDLPVFKRFQAENPQKIISGQATAIMFGRAIQWLSFLDILWPDFKTTDYYSVEVRYIVINDPDVAELPDEFYYQMAHVFEMFWRIQLSDLYPDGNWKVEIHDDPELTVDVNIYRQRI